MLDYIRLEVLDMSLSNLVFSLRLPNIIGVNYQRMLLLLTYKEPMNMFFDTVSRVKIFVEGRGATLCVYRRDQRLFESSFSLKNKFIWSRNFSRISGNFSRSD